jgi:hypothetical protein
MAIQQTSIAEQVRKIFERHLPGARIAVELQPGARKVSGSVIWEGFVGKEQIDRQRMLHGLLRAELGPDAQEVSIFFTYTSTEYDAMGRD